MLINSISLNIMKTRNIKRGTKLQNGMTNSKKEIYKNDDAYKGGMFK